MQLIRRSAIVASLLALTALGACSSDPKTLTAGSTPATTQLAPQLAPTTSTTPAAATTDGIVTSSIATDGSTSTSIGGTADPGATTASPPSTTPVIVSSSVATGSTVSSGNGPANGSASTSSVAAPPAEGPGTTTADDASPGSITPGAAVTVPDDTTPVATGNPTAFCAFEADIEDATNTNDDATFLTALGTFEPKMAQWEADAPNVQLHAAAAKLHEVTKEAIAAHSTDPFDGDALNDAFVPISTFCGSLGAST